MMNATTDVTWDSVFGVWQEMKRQSVLASTKVSVNRYLCNGGKFVRWKRSHRKSRINKKWHKRYGMILSKCSGVCYEVQGIGMVMCPCVEAQLKKETHPALKADRPSWLLGVGGM